MHRLISYRSSRLPVLMRVWLLAVTALAVAVAAYELAQVLGWRSPVSDLSVSGALMLALAAVFTFVFVATRRPRSGLAAVAAATDTPRHSRSV